jgi:hypothetical protein
MNRELTQQDFEKLQPLEAHLTRGFYGRYIYGLRKGDFNRLIEVYHDLGYAAHTMEYSCNRCLMQLTSTLGKLYFDYKKKMEENPEPAKNAKRKVGEYNLDGELLREFESVTKAVEETGISKNTLYKSLKDNETIDDRKYAYITA